MRIAVAQYYQAAIKEHAWNPRRMWRVLNKSCPFKATKKGPKIDSKQKADEFNNYFANVSNTVKKELDEVINTFRVEKHNVEASRNIEEFEMRKSTPDDIEDLISKLDCSKSAGIDFISYQCFQIYMRSLLLFK